MDSTPGSISYAKNGKDLGECFQVERSGLEDKALFPHILTKNTSFEVNFGGQVSGTYFADDFVAYFALARVIFGLGQPLWSL